MSAEEVLVNGQIKPGPAARTVLVFESPAGNTDLKTRIGTHTALLERLSEELTSQAGIVDD